MIVGDEDFDGRVRTLGKEYRVSGFVIGVQLIASLLSSALLLLSFCVAAGIPSNHARPIYGSSFSGSSIEASRLVRCRLPQSPQEKIEAIILISAEQTMARAGRTLAPKL
jgi:hypothetical protein